jgi:cell wall-associated NlpC family hydrolase
VAITTLSQSCAMPQHHLGTSTMSTPLPAPAMNTLVATLRDLTSSLEQLVHTLHAHLVYPAAHTGCAHARSGAVQVSSPSSHSPIQGSMYTAAAPAAVVREPQQAMFAAPVPQPDTSPQSADIGSQIVRDALQHLGKPYRFAAAGPDAFDCSGLTLAIYRRFGVKLPHKAAIQATMGTAVSRSDLRPGDLVFFANKPDGSVGHTGIYIGNNQFIHAPRTGDVVKISRLDEGYYARHYSGARRYV